MQQYPIYTGALKDEIDERDYQWSRIPGASMFDWSKGFDVEVELKKRLGNAKFRIFSKDQHKSFSCGGQAWSYYMAVIEAMATGTYEERSAKFIYSQTFAPGGGSNGRPNCEICSNQGSALEADCPSYYNGTTDEPFMTRPQDITTKARNTAGYSKALVYANVAPNIDLMANACHANNGLIIALEGADNGTWRSTFPKPPTKTAWAHWLFVSGATMINGKKYLKVKNSWGDEVGASGCQYIGEDYFQAYKVWNGWTMPFNKANLVAKLKGEQLSLMKQLLNLLKEQLAKLL
jgi:hypothetical protein